MKLAALFSGGKDSTYAIHLAKKLSHSVDVLLTLYPHSDESHLLHHPNIKFTTLQSESMGIPQLIEEIPSIENETEFKKLEKLITMAKENHSIEGIVHGGILSKYQKDNFSLICQKNDLEIISPLWNKNPEFYMKELLEENFDLLLHFAGFIQVEESVQNPDKYFKNNTDNAIELFETCYKHNLQNIIFSSTAAAY